MTDLLEIRDALNAQPFHNGKRRVPLGPPIELFPDAPDMAVADKLTRLQGELRRHDLALIEEDGELFAEQKLRTLPVDLSWLAGAYQWVAKITTVALEMALPGIAGWWLDRQFGTSFLMLTLTVLGVVVGLWHLMMMTRRRPDDVD